jgi:hypothetical protein
MNGETQKRTRKRDRFFSSFLKKRGAAAASGPAQPTAAAATAADAPEHSDIPLVSSTAVPLATNSIGKADVIVLPVGRAPPAADASARTSITSPPVDPTVMAEAVPNQPDITSSKVAPTPAAAEPPKIPSLPIAPLPVAGDTRSGAEIISPPIDASSTSLPAMNVRPHDEFVSEALDLLGKEDRAVVEQYFIASNISETIRSAYEGANELKTKAKDSRGIGAKVSKVISWIDQFKSVGDSVAMLDPIHAGLPWAGIKILLSIAIADINQMETLVTGMDLALEAANRLRAYFLYYKQLPNHLTTDNFRKALIKMYAKVLAFLAQAFKVYKTKLWLRGLRTFWQDSTIRDFEEDGDKLSQRLEIEASNCDRFMSDRTAAAKWRDDLYGKLEKLDGISRLESKLQDLNVNVDLSKLPVVAGAKYNSSEESQLASCLNGTRIDLLGQIDDWAENREGKSIYWLCGGAGTGKSTISRTVAQRFDRKKQLGGSFFFKQSDADRGNADRFFPTIVRQLADQIPALKQPVADAIDQDSSLCTSGLQDQFDRLFKKPLMSIEPKQLPHRCIVIVVDALDECDRKHTKKFLTLLAGINSVSRLRLRVFVTSRPKHQIEIGFDMMDVKLHDDHDLEKDQVASIEHDLERYFDHEFRSIRTERAHGPYDPLPDDWPSQKEILELTMLATPLFIYAATVCRFVQEGASPRKRLSGILDHKHLVPSLRLQDDYAHLRLMYSQILSEATRSDDPEEAAEKIQDFKKIVGPILIAAVPLSVETLSYILQIDADDISAVLSPLKSVLDVPRDRTKPVQRRHLSFREYLLDPKNKEDFRIDEQEVHAQFALQCVQFLMDFKALRQDICDVKHPGFKRRDITETKVAECIPPHVAYACMYWANHLAAGQVPTLDGTELVYEFLTTHFLHWLEVMSWLEKFRLVISSIEEMIGITKVRLHPLLFKPRLTKQRNRQMSVAA